MSDTFPRPVPVPLTGVRREIWERALPYVDVRDDDTHSLYSLYSCAPATALLEALPSSRADVVLIAVLLHDTSWKTVDPVDILPAIAGRSGPAGQETIRRHETGGAAGHRRPHPRRSRTLPCRRCRTHRAGPYRCQRAAKRPEDTSTQ